jgi:hypothetical protein
MKMSRSRSSPTSSSSRSTSVSSNLGVDLRLAFDRSVCPYAGSAAQRVDRAVLRGRHQPRARLVDALGRPLLERGDERVLRELFRDADVAHEPREPRDQARRLDPEDRFDRPPGFGVVGRAHGRRSQHLLGYVRKRILLSPCARAARGAVLSLLDLEA